MNLEPMVQQARTHPIWSLSPEPLRNAVMLRLLLLQLLCRHARHHWCTFCCRLQRDPFV